jgi:hypothetical protein
MSRKLRARDVFPEVAPGVELQLATQTPDGRTIPVFLSIRAAAKAAGVTWQEARRAHWAGYVFIWRGRR